MDRRWYLDINRLARETSWGHGFMTAFYDRALSPVGAGLLVLAVLTVGGWLSARRQPEHMPATLWSGLGALVALGINQVVLQQVARPMPYEVVSHVEVLVSRAPHGYAFPSGHAAFAAAVVCGLFLARRRRLGALALLTAAVLWFSAVYVGAALPSEVAAGAGLGAVTELVLWPLGSWLLTPLVTSVGDSALSPFVSSKWTSKRTRPLAPQGQARPGLFNARAMDALRAATEAARSAGPAQVAPGPVSPAVNSKPTVNSKPAVNSRPVAGKAPPPAEGAGTTRGTSVRPSAVRTIVERQGPSAGRA
jgi:membrane-associated phospholipid phosphatase